MLNIIDKLEEYKKVLEEAKGYDDTIEKILFEEMGELIQAVSKMGRIDIRLKDLSIQKCLSYKRDEREIIKNKLEEAKGLKENKFKENLHEEMADVIICLYWIASIYDVKGENIAKWIDKKCNRMDTRLGEGDFY